MTYSRLFTSFLARFLVIYVVVVLATNLARYVILQTADPELLWIPRIMVHIFASAFRPWIAGLSALSAAIWTLVTAADPTQPEHENPPAPHPVDADE